MPAIDMFGAQRRLSAKFPDARRPAGPRAAMLRLVGLGYGGPDGLTSEAVEAIRAAAAVFAPSWAVPWLKTLRRDARTYDRAAALRSAAEPSQTVVCFGGHPLFFNEESRFLIRRPDVDVVCGVSPADWAFSALALKLHYQLGFRLIAAKGWRPEADPPDSFTFVRGDDPAALAGKAAAVYGRERQAAWIFFPEGEPPRTRRGTLARLSRLARPGGWGLLVLPGPRGPELTPAMRAGLGVRLAGLGMPQLQGATGAALRAIEAGRSVFTMDPTLKYFAALGTARPIGAMRPTTAGLLRRALDASARPAAVTIYGHPMIYEPFCADIVDACLRRGVPCSVAPAVSTIDAVFAVLKVPLLDRGLQVTTRAHALKSELDPRCWVVVFKACEDLRALRKLARRLARWYPNSARCALVRCRNFDDPGDVAWTTVAGLPDSADRAEVFRTLVLPPIS